jgi:hypothetical protein
LEVPGAQSLIFCVVCYRSLFVLLSLRYLSFDLRLLIATFVYLQTLRIAYTLSILLTS